MNSIPFRNRVVSLLIFNFGILLSNVAMSNPTETQASPNDSYWLRAKAPQESPALAKDSRV